jgi:transcriptional regulator with XRE-family HTH domain
MARKNYDSGTTAIDYGLLARKIGEKRRLDGLGVRDAATQCGISYSTLNRLERGTAQPDVPILMRVLAWLELSPSSLLMGPQPVRAHLRAQKTLASDVAEAIAEVVPVARFHYQTLSSRDLDTRSTIDSKSPYRRLRSSLREEFAHRFRAAINHQIDTPIEPFDLEVDGVQVKRLDEVPDVSAKALSILTTSHRNAWSAVTLPLDDSESSWLILLNSTHTRERQRATLMEEICHVLLGHHLTTISHVEGQTFRDYNREQEQDAYGLGAAILIPKAALIKRIESGESAATIATHFGVSHELVEYRIKITGAWYPYQLRQHVKMS